VVVTPAAYSNSVLPGSHSPGCVGGPQLRGDVCVPRDDVGPPRGRQTPRPGVTAALSRHKASDRKPCVCLCCDASVPAISDRVLYSYACAHRFTLRRFEFVSIQCMCEETEINGTAARVLRSHIEYFSPCSSVGFSHFVYKLSQPSNERRPTQ
jgi:hypothetical protein